MRQVASTKTQPELYLYPELKLKRFARVDWQCTLNKQNVVVPAILIERKPRQARIVYVTQSLVLLYRNVKPEQLSLRTTEAAIDTIVQVRH